MDEMEMYDQRPAGSALFSTSESFIDSIKDLDFMTDVSEDQLNKIEGGDDSSGRRRKRRPANIKDFNDFFGNGQPIIISNDVNLEGIAIPKKGGTAVVNQNVNIFNKFIFIIPGFFQKRGGSSS
ncbi:MAG: hypothetical protein F6K63_00515 [Moorea sp. SIO1G6]|uniref:hypothetical protein n=1 Tax=Moorena sp. SIO1G6 TaxID=2607840 RepID=UPI0013C11798|nr:hypothetical protein [Moorena sp. SIO1G6]NES83605.1 hypothetical protein [Moorena sp. SIO2B7]NET62958.1 hypothetical protein [Moorena sp. SIO1G6]